MRSADVLETSGSVVARDLRGGGQAPRFTAGRRCAVDGCRTILSSYNAGDRCWAHREATPVLSLGMRRRAREDEGPRVLDEGEEHALIEALVGRGTIRPRRIAS